METINVAQMQHLLREMRTLEALTKKLQKDIKELKEKLNPEVAVDTTELLTPKELQHGYGISRRTLQKMRERGAIHAIRINERVHRYSLQEIQKYLNEQANGY